MDRYIAAELIPPFLLSVGIVSSLGVAIGNLSDLANKIVESNLPLSLAIEVFLLKIPEFIAYAFPISILLATLMAYGRLSKDSELIALQGCGVGIYRLVAPAIVLSLVVTGITFLFNELVVPAANYRATAILVNTIQEEHSFWQTKDIFYPEYEKVILPNGEATQRLKSLFYAEQFDGKNMKTLTIISWLGEKLDRIIVSDSAVWNPTQKTWDFFRGTLYNIAPDASYGHTLHFKHQQLSLSQIPFDLASQGRDPDEMNIVQAREYMTILKLSGNAKKLLMFQVRTHQKIAFPFVCLVFGIVGSALGVRPQQVGRATSFGVSIAIVFTYYVLGFIGGSLGLIGILSPFMAAWLPNVLGLGVGGWLLAKVER
jgi:lipopolysaccharide export system permease protein